MLALACIAMVATTSRFVAFTRFDKFSVEETPMGVQLASPVIQPGMDWNEMILSWNVDGIAPGSVEAVAEVVDGPVTKSFQMGRWVFGGLGDTSESYKGQKDISADVLTDTLRFSSPSSRPVRVRLEFRSNPSVLPKFIGVCFADTSKPPTQEHIHKEAWGKTIEVAPLSQMSYPNGKVLCSPTCVAMALRHWAAPLSGPGFSPDVPEVASGVFDKTWNGTGNWTFNAAFAGSRPGMRAYVARLEGVPDLERWIEAGVPVVCSVSLELIQGKPKKPEDGHLVLLIGFTKDGDPVFNDPGWSKEVRHVYKRSDFEAAWECSHRTVYLIYPLSVRAPKHSGGRWLERG